MRRKRATRPINSGLVNPALIVILLFMVVMALFPSWQIISNRSECEIGKLRALEDFANNEIGEYIRLSKIDHQAPCIVYEKVEIVQSNFPILTTEIIERCYWQTIDSLKEHSPNTYIDSEPIPIAPDEIIDCGLPSFTYQRPQYKGGDEQLLRFIRKNIEYPSTALRDSIQGRVIIRFTVDTLGNVIDPVVLRGIRGDLDSAAFEAIYKTSGNWEPLQLGNRKVNSYFTLPIMFQMTTD